MRPRSLSILIAALGFCACSPPAAAADTPPPQHVQTETQTRPDNYAAFSAVLVRHQAMSERVARISRDLRVANAPLCAVTRPDVGLSSHRLSDYPEALRPLALHFMDLGDNGRYVRGVVPGSPADRADIAAGDRILSGWPVSEKTALITQSGPVEMQPDLACVTPTFVINSQTPNASTNGREIELSTALVEQVPDDAALALIIAHEMAHVLRGHTPDGPRWTAELQADADALTLMRNAGYDIATTVAGWEAGIEAHRESQALSATHPPVHIRLRNLQAALQRLNARPSGFLPLEDDSDP